MAVGGCLKEYVEICEILVCVPGDANPGLYTRLRFALLASSWLPNPLGIALWRALHVVMLVVGGPAFWALALLANFLVFDVCCLALLTLWIGTFGAFYVMVAVVVDLGLFVGRSMRFCWSVVGFLACHAPLGKWRDGTWFTPGFVDELTHESAAFFAKAARIGVPCMRGSWYMENKDRMWETWARWWKEVVHAQEAVVL